MKMKPATLTMSSKLWIVLPTVFFGSVMFVAGHVFAREIHVSQAGDDSGPGSRVSPYLTINKAASVAKPGDTVIVHAGTYREWVKPVRGGTGEKKRITYRAAAGEDVFIKGSERITTWKKQESGVWKVDLPNSFFGDYNPYALQVSGSWLTYGHWHHRGDVYLNGEAYYEKQTTQEVSQTSQSWHCRVDGNVTTILANFGQSDPNEEMAEINVRESLFMPVRNGLDYITVDGFHFAHAAANWAPPDVYQTGAVGPRIGKRWIIENCTIVNARCVGIILGLAPGVKLGDIDAFGGHIIRNNIIRRCGQAGIAGVSAATRSLISGNLIEDTNYRREFGGWETAAIKFHMLVDTVIENNLIRRVYHQQHGAFGIWIDFACQGVRITRNVICDTQSELLFLEMNHGPTLVDNNILIGNVNGKEVLCNSEATVFAHNLFVDCGYFFRPDQRESSWYTPHTFEAVGVARTTQDDRWFNNIFIRQGPFGRSHPHTASDYNVFYEGAQKSHRGDEHSIVDPLVTKLNRKDSPTGVTISFLINNAPFDVKTPWVDDALVGVFPTVGQTIEDRYGNPLKVDTDFYGKKRTRPIPGPLHAAMAGPEIIEWKTACGTVLDAGSHKPAK